jgi:hypothetical protein
VTRAVAQGPGSVITVQRSHLLRNGLPWVPRGVQIVGIVAPDGALSGKYVAAHAEFGTPELEAAVAEHADLIRFQVSEFGLDPQGPLYSPGYVQEVQGAVQSARALGLAVIVSLQAEPPAGEPTRCPLPDAGAERAWNELAPMFAGDGDVMFELYNEPGVSATPGGWIQWRVGGEVIYPGGACEAVGVQPLVDEIRAQAPGNVIIVPGLGGEQSLSGRLPIVDPAHRGDPQLAYGVHYPSLTRGSTAWDRTFGDAAGTVPVIVTEWDANSTTSCVAAAPEQSQLLLDYLATKQIGVVGFAFDLPGTIVADSVYTPTSDMGFTCGVPNGGPGELLFGDFAAEARAGDGTRPDPAPAWIVSAATLARLDASIPVTVTRLFDTPRTFVTGAAAASLPALGVPNAIAATSFASTAALARAATAGTLRPGTGALIDAPGGTRATPASERRNPAEAFQRAAQAAHAHGLLLVAAPALTLATAPATAPARRRDAQFLRSRLAAAAARYADAVAIPSQGTETDAAGFTAFVEAAARQATRAHRSVELLGGLTGGTPRSAVTAPALFTAFLSTRLSVAGYAFDDPAGAAADPGPAFLSRLVQLDG